MLTDEAFLHFLPAYMSASIRDPEEADVAHEGTAWAFVSRRFATRTHLLAEMAPDQRKCVFAFLEHFLDLCAEFDSYQEDASYEKRRLTELRETYPDGSY